MTPALESQLKTTHNQTMVAIRIEFNDDFERLTLDNKPTRSTIETEAMISARILRILAKERPRDSSPCQQRCFATEERPLASTTFNNIFASGSF